MVVLHEDGRRPRRPGPPRRRPRRCCRPGSPPTPPASGGSGSGAGAAGRRGDDGSTTGSCSPPRRTAWPGRCRRRRRRGRESRPSLDHAGPSAAAARSAGAHRHRGPRRCRHRPTSGPVQGRGQPPAGWAPARSAPLRHRCGGRTAGPGWRRRRVRLTAGGPARRVRRGRARRGARRSAWAAAARAGDGSGGCALAQVDLGQGGRTRGAWATSIEQTELDRRSRWRTRPSRRPSGALAVSPASGWRMPEASSGNSSSSAGRAIELGHPAAARWDPPFEGARVEALDQRGAARRTGQRARACPLTKAGVVLATSASRKTTTSPRRRGRARAGHGTGPCHPLPPGPAATMAWPASRGLLGRLVSSTRRRAR